LNILFVETFIKTLPVNLDDFGIEQNSLHEISSRLWTKRQK